MSGYYNFFPGRSLEIMIFGPIALCVFLAVCLAVSCSGLRSPVRIEWVGFDGESEERDRYE